MKALDAPAIDRYSPLQIRGYHCGKVKQSGNNMKIEGCVTSTGTATYRDRFKEGSAKHHFRNEQGLWLSSIGIGTYLGNPDKTTDEGYEAAVLRAVELGANLIDTAANYRFQRSERAVGLALSTLIEKQLFGRDEVIICTKGGYLPFDGAPPTDVGSYIQETFVKTGLAKREDFVGGSHCMTPAYLQNQLDQSLENLGLSCIDVYYIHNPESQLGFISLDEFYDKVRNAFDILERIAAQGKIKFYGIASWNGFRLSSDSEHYHSLTKMVEIAQDVGGAEHRFRFVQLPFNLAMPEALTLRNHVIGGKQVCTLEAAAALGVTVISSASILQGRLARGLPESLRQSLGSLATDAQSALQFVRSTPGITTALVGMSNRNHVQENLQLIHIDPLRAEEFRRLFAEGMADR